MALLVFLSLLSAAPGAVAQEAETTLWFVGEGGDEVVTSPDGDGIYEMSPDGHGGQTSSFITVLGNNVENNPFLPTFTHDAPVVLTGGTITAYHHAAVTGAAAGCGLVGYLYSGADVLAQTEPVPATDGLAYEEFVFVFEGVEGTYASLSFQPVQSANQCGWASIEHVWGSDDFPGRLVLPAAEAAGAVDVAKAVLENLAAPAFLHEFDNATSEDYTLNFTVPWQNATLRQTAEVVSGSANVTVFRDGEVFMAVLLTNQTAPAPADKDAADGNATGGNGTAPDAPVLRDVAGNWSVVIDYEGFVGRLGLELAEHVPAPESVDTTDEPSLGADASGADSPGPALPLLALALLALVVVRRRP